MKRPDQIVIASKNAHKIVEFEDAFKNTGITIKSLQHFPDAPNVDESGKTFADNATLKASAIMKYTGQAVIADDSGLVVASLDGDPGVHSARYAGDHDDAANNAKLLKEMQNKANRDAYFESVLIYLTPEGDKVEASGRVNGQILTSPRGNNNFGYDPLFYVPEKQMTLAEMTTHDKNMISHRGRAIKQLISKLLGLWD
ncbi:XTP/dITP diphosphatase [Lentilactobacillus kisonensis]|uniref:dITP/XTP pyrophosphatase n=2 Tax=Lentilactobacillus kisonensis TaxID=481722 RepID=H1LJL8_9LACO|nr:XTP/dITP diphosphatase [Lentilactobacillus kisonensis]EHO48590.1 non-canonical purine NTP pyrophosphatase, RdgB/HAM1 family [Lentilactobacillus kisonensis F0435]KRL21840.1 non-canonical purine NTP pyrophosphatase, RdgB HAM1 family [Lentilactobacillus kisonensis DSM 19906 = JCM 15041]